ncbi:MAG: glycosyltransferase family 39 protein [Chloroflexi bacterium]|nr:glycosyltransferase family 39 protein [Chloroflexota bacterium]
MLVILLIGFFLRVHELGARSFWVDEAYTWGVAVKTSWADVWKAMLVVSDVSPLPYVITKLAVPLFGSREFGLRLSSAFFGWLAISITYQLGRATFNAATGVTAAALIAFSPFAVWYSQDARPYGLYLFLGGLVLWCFWQAERGKSWVVFIAASAAFYVTQYVSALFVYAQAVYILTQLRRQPLVFRKWALAQALAVIPVAGWVLAFLAQRQPLTANTWIPEISLTTPLKTLWNFVRGDTAGWTAFAVVGVAIVIILLVLGTRTGTREAQLLLWWLALPITTAWLFSLRLPAYIDRFFEPALLSVALLSSAALANFQRGLRLAVILLVTSYLLLGSIRLYTEPVFAKEDWRGATQVLYSENLTVGLPDGESLLGITPYVTTPLNFAFARNTADLNARLAEGPFVLVLRSPHESAHALSKSAPFDPLTEGPSFFKQWRLDNPGAPLEVRSFTGLALVIIGK